MKNGATIVLEASWALNVLDSREASTTLCGTKAGAEIRSGMSYKDNELIYNRGRNNQLMEEHISGTGQVAYFEGGASEPGALEAKQWIDCIIDESKDPLVLPEQAYVVTQILDAIYKSDAEGKEVVF